MPDSLTIFYTAHLRGNLHRLPYLHTHIQRLKTRLDVRPLLLDLGDTCAPEVWHCAATGGRSTFIVLDGMGYHAALTAEQLASGERQKLADVVSMGLVDAAHPWRYEVPPERDDGIIAAVSPVPALRLCIQLAPTEQTQLHDGVLFLGEVPPFAVGVAALTLRPQPQLMEAAVYPLPDGLPPDATISGAVEFVEDEARYYQQKRP